jgi:hypothetical protein
VVTRSLALQEADTDDRQGTLGFEEFCAFYKMMSTRRDLYLLMLTYSNHKDHLEASDLQRFLEVEQKVRPRQEWCDWPAWPHFSSHHSGLIALGQGRSQTSSNPPNWLWFHFQALCHGSCQVSGEVCRVYLLPVSE